MNCRTWMITGFIALMVWCAATPGATAGSVEEIKDGATETVSAIRKEAVRAGNAAARTGREIKEGAVKAGVTVKEGTKEVGRDIKKAFQKTKNAVAEEFTGDAPRDSSGH
jgi:predicted transcriptional regulator